MTTITCLVCGAAEEPGADRTCPVCGADLPAGPDDAADPTDEPPPCEVPTAPTFDDARAATGAPTAPPPPSAPTAPQDPTWPTSGSPVPPPPPAGGSPAPSTRPSPYDPAHPSGLSSSLRTYGMLTHLSAFAGAVVALAFVGPLVLWLVRRDEHPFVDHHGKEALNFNLSMLLYGLIGIIVSVATLGLGLVVVLPAAAVFFVTWVVTTILAAVKANAGEGYRYPLTIRFVRDDV